MRAGAGIVSGGRALLLVACIGAGSCAPVEEANHPRPRGKPEFSPLFVDVTAESGVDFVHEAGARGAYRLPELMGPGVALLDYDRDQDLDLFFVQGGEMEPESTADHRCALYRNDGGWRFTDVSAAARADLRVGGRRGYGMGCAAADYDGDGWVDLFVTCVGPDVLLRNRGDGTFEDVTQSAGLGDPGFGTSAVFFDYDRDGARALRSS